MFVQIDIILYIRGFVYSFVTGDVSSSFFFLLSSFFFLPSSLFFLLDDARLFLFIFVYFLLLYFCTGLAPFTSYIFYQTI